MRAVICEATGPDVQLVDDVEVRAPRAGEVLVRVAYCGLCHSDLLVRDSPLAPVVLGHEVAGWVERVGDGVAHVAEGDAVVATVALSCGRCDACTTGHPAACRSGGVTGELPGGGTGFQRRGQALFRSVGVGGFVEHVVMPAGAVVAVPNDTPLDQACLLGCGVGTGLGAVINTARVRPGETVVVFGVGGVGIAAVQGARIAGAAQIIAVDPVEERRTLALRFGATATLAPDEQTPRQVKNLTNGGADHAIETAGRQDTFDAALAATRVGGSVTLVGMPGANADAYVINRASAFILSEKRILGSAYGSCQPQRDVPRFLALARAGELDLAGMITAIRPLSEIGRAIEDLEAGRGIRTVIDIGAE